MRDAYRLNRRPVLLGYMGPAWTVVARLADVLQIADWFEGHEVLEWLLSLQGAILVGILGLGWVFYAARWPLRGCGDDLEEGWLRDRLVELKDGQGDLLFESKLVEEQFAKCFTNLRDFGIFTKSQALRFLKDKKVRNFLIDKYKQVLLRKKPQYLDPDGYCHWGAMLHRASIWERRDVYEYVDARLREHHHMGST